MLTSEVDPIRFVSARVLEAVKAMVAAEAAAAVLLERWARLLDAFRCVRWEVPPGAHLAGARRPVAEMLARKYPSLPDADHVPADEADETSAARHWQLGQQCTRAEKLALRHLAEEGFLNPNAQEVVRPLMRRLLVRRDPAFCLPTEAFRRFVLRAETCATIGAWERAGVPRAWVRLRGPLMVLALLVPAYPRHATLLEWQHPRQRRTGQMERKSSPAGYDVEQDMIGAPTVIESNEAFNDLFDFADLPEPTGSLALTASQLMERVSKYVEPTHFKALGDDQGKVASRVLVGEMKAEAKVPLQLNAEHPSYPSLAFLPVIAAKEVLGSQDQPHETLMLVTYIKDFVPLAQP